jgi:thiol-disulfide isomerase/thioredoxin
MAKYKLIKFESGTCAYCKSMDKTKVLEKFAAKHADVTVVKCMIADDKGVPFNDAMKWADAYGIGALPTLVVETDDGRELVREEGAMPLSAIEKLLERAKAREAMGSLTIPAEAAAEPSAEPKKGGRRGEK